MEAIFTFTPHDHPSSSKMIEDLSLQDDFQRFMRMNDGVELRVTIAPSVITAEKERMYAYYHRVILNVAIQVFTNDGWEAVDKVKADYLLKAECAKEPMYNKNTGEEEIYLLDKAAMNKDRLKKFITDCITFLEVEKGARVPDSASYLMEIRTGISGFQSVNSKKNK